MNPTNPQKSLDPPRASSIRPRRRRPARPIPDWHSRPPRPASTNGATLFAPARWPKVRLLGCHLHPRDGPYRAGHVRVQTDAAAARSTNRSGNISTAASPTGGSSMARRRCAGTPPCSPDRTGFCVNRGTLLALWGVEIRLWGSAGAAEPYGARVPVLPALAWVELMVRSYWGTQLLNASWSLSAAGVVPGRHEQLLGRRHGAYRWMPNSGPTLHGPRRRRPRLAVWGSAGRRARLFGGAIWSIAGKSMPRT